MKKTTLLTIMALSLTSGMVSTASANSGPSVHTSYEEGVKVYRPIHPKPDFQAKAAFKALKLQERQIDNEARLGQARLRSETRTNRDRLALDRRIAFTNNEIFSNRRSRNNRRFTNGGLSNRFFGVNGISRNTRVSQGFN